uniref:Troponin I n=1 Tax=Dolomedes sulfureus TaxID=492288 RepID=A0A0P0DIU3_9ARAC|nr:troponin I [Dolomedes sulfureus]
MKLHCKQFAKNTIKEFVNWKKQNLIWNTKWGKKIS